jgi:hypothetical protein
MDRAIPPWQFAPIGDSGGASGAGQGVMLYCNKFPPSLAPSMPPHGHHPHHHHPGTGHPPASIAPSMLRMSAVERLAIAAVLIAALWGVVRWAMT